MVEVLTLICVGHLNWVWFPLYCTLVEEPDLESVVTDDCEE